MADNSYTREELEAMRISAMLRGVDLASISSQMADDDDFDIEIVADEPKKKSRKAKKAENKPRVPASIQFKSQFDRVPKDLFENVLISAHDIPYKEQAWPIPSRTVRYDFDILKGSGQVKRKIEDNFKHLNIKNRTMQQEIDDATNGNVMYLSITTHENVHIKLVEIGLIRLEENNGKLVASTYVDTTKLKDCHINADKVEKNIKAKVKENILQR